MENQIVKRHGWVRARTPEEAVQLTCEVAHAKTVRILDSYAPILWPGASDETIVWLGNGMSIRLDLATATQRDSRQSPRARLRVV